MYADSKGRLTLKNKGTLILMPGDRADFEISYPNGTIRHRKSGRTWNFKPITSWEQWEEDVLIASRNPEPLEGTNTPPEVYPGNGPAFAALKAGIVTAAVLIDSAPHNSLDYPYLEWKRRVENILKVHGEVWLGKFENGNFEKLSKK